MTMFQTGLKQGGFKQENTTQASSVFCIPFFCCGLTYQHLTNILRRTLNSTRGFSLNLIEQHQKKNTIPPPFFTGAREADRMIHPKIQTHQSANTQCPFFLNSRKKTHKSNCMNQIHLCNFRLVQITRSKMTAHAVQMVIKHCS